MSENQTNLPALLDDENAVVERFVEASREIMPSVQVTLAKRIVRPGSNKVLCLAARTTMPLDEDQVSSVSDLALRLSDGTNVALSLSFFNDATAGDFIPFTRNVYDPQYYTRQSNNDSKLSLVLVSMALVALAGTIGIWKGVANFGAQIASVAKPAAIVSEHKKPAAQRTIAAAPTPYVPHLAPVEPVVGPPPALTQAPKSSTHRVKSEHRHHHSSPTAASNSEPAYHGGGYMVPPPPPMPMTKGMLVPPPPPYDPTTGPMAQFAGYTMPVGTPIVNLAPASAKSHAKVAKAVAPEKPISIEKAPASQAQMQAVGAPSATEWHAQASSAAIEPQHMQAAAPTRLSRPASSVAERVSELMPAPAFASAPTPGTSSQAQQFERIQAPAEAQEQ